MKGVRFGKMLINKGKEAPADVCCHALARWRFEPQNVFPRSGEIPGQMFQDVGKILIISFWFSNVNE